MTDWIIREGSMLDKPRYFQPRHDGTAYTPYGDKLDRAILFRSPCEAELVLNWLQSMGHFLREGRWVTLEDESASEMARQQINSRRIAELEEEMSKTRNKL